MTLLQILALIGCGVLVAAILGIIAAYFGLFDDSDDFSNYCIRKDVEKK